MPFVVVLEDSNGESLMSSWLAMMVTSPFFFSAVVFSGSWGYCSDREQRVDETESGFCFVCFALRFAAYHHRRIKAAQVVPGSRSPALVPADACSGT